MTTAGRRSLDRSRDSGRAPVTRNAVIDDYRASHPTVGLDAVADRVSAEPGPEQAVETIAQREELVEALEQLPRDEHDVLVYRFFVGLAPAEVAPLMDRSDGAVRVLQHRALRRLRALLSADDMRPVPAGART
ncbi:MAG: sigma-70 family RNA polymerase sigma factor [Chloroflexi bacterium]|nr:sigma-70 family RNA polymerase sigma factor [Chloroflexota bacterium]